MIICYIYAFKNVQTNLWTMMLHVDVICLPLSFLAYGKLYFLEYQMQVPIIILFVAKGYRLNFSKRDTVLTPMENDKMWCYVIES